MKKIATLGKPSNLTRLMREGRRGVTDSLAWDPSHDYSVQLIRSVVVSIVALIVNFAGSYILKEKLHFYYLAAATISYSLGVLVNYYLSVVWVFAKRQLASRHAEFVIFVGINLVGLVFNVALIAAMVELAKLDYWVALTVATIIVFFWNFLARKRILY